MGRPSNPLLSRDAIAAAALDLAVEDGAEAVTMRAIAARLGVRGPSLYNHVASKDDLLDAMTAHISNELRDAVDESLPWREGVAQYARVYRKVFLRHHAILPVIARRPVQTREALDGYDALARLLLALRLPAAEVAEVSAAVDYLVLGSVLETYTAGFVRPAEGYRPDHPALADTLEAAGEAPGGLAGLDERGFERGLALLLDGLAGRVARLG